MPEAWKSLLHAGWDQYRALELAIAIEEMGAETYRDLARRWASSEDLCTLFTSLAGAEAVHRERIRSLLPDAARWVDDSVPLDMESLRAIAHGFFFSDEGWALGGIEKLTLREQVLEKVLRFENATLHFYRGLKDVLGPSRALDALIAEEKRHAVEIMREVARTERSAA